MQLKYQKKRQALQILKKLKLLNKLDNINILFNIMIIIIDKRSNNLIIMNVQELKWNLQMKIQKN